ncbi:alpha/beta fold hydrolase [Nocardia aurantiaca]|uniref:Alpha/beta fold hydrolase n=1 Tax=Nocardia aurantiaca TaxID=2675850 RepID=A0A6I3KW70_9NOCA|nr:alpha/beta hydrolase [Nocardia aurantiaca]MTE13847.1 alpha/beta fold hydrolase [Nocardia aurantiaca]
MARILLIPGFWLGAWAWEDVAGPLRSLGDEVDALTLPGLDPGDPERLSATLQTQARAIVDAARAADVLVAHSGAGAAAYMATDLAPEHFSRVIYADSAPMPAGFILNPALGDTAEFPLPETWEEVEAAGSSLAGLNEAMLARFRERAVPVPAGVAARPVTLGDSAARLKVPTTVICCSFPSELVQQLRDAGELPLFRELRNIDAEYVDLPTGHWPMWSKPTELAELIHHAVQR